MQNYQVTQPSYPPQDPYMVKPQQNYPVIQPSAPLQDTYMMNPQQTYQQGYPQPNNFGQQGMQSPPQMVVTVMPQQNFEVVVPSVPQGRQPQNFFCPVCQKTKTSHVMHKMGGGSWLYVGVCLVVCFPAACFPFCVNDCKDAVHTCPECHREVGRDKFLNI